MKKQAKILRTKAIESLVSPPDNGTAIRVVEIAPLNPAAEAKAAKSAAN